MGRKTINFKRILLKISGEVLAFNKKLEEAPDLINSDPYGDGWVIKISVSDTTELTSLLDAASYKELVG